MELSRREFLKLLGVSTGATALGAWGASTIFSVPDEVFERAFTGPHIETWKNSICSQCPGGCGIRVRLIDGIPVRVTGNPAYPINRGAVCPMAEAGIEALFHPDRIRGPLKRMGKRGENRWEHITWEEAISAISDRLLDLRQQGTPEKLAMTIGDGNDLSSQLSRRFMAAFGSPNHHHLSDARIYALPVQLAQGLDGPPAYDLANTNCVLNFGGDLLDEGPSPIRFNQLYAELRARKEQTRARIIHIGSFMSRTAANSSEWIPIKPGTMAALALSIAYVMIKDGSYDKDFIRRRSFGFSDWKDATGKQHTGFKTVVSGEYYPERVAGITGVPANKIVEIARDFAAVKPALAIAGGQAAFTTNGLYTSWAIYCLNALKGNLGKQGGVLFPKEMIAPRIPEVPTDPVARAGLKKPKLRSEEGAPLAILVDSLDRLLPALEESQPYAIDTLIVYRANPLFESTNQVQYAAALEKVPFIVSCTSFMNETSAHADLVLPEPVFLEKWEVSLENPSVEFLHFGVQQPVIKPLYDTWHFGDVLLQVGKRLGGKVAEALPWEKYERYIKTHAEAIFNSGEGTIVSESAKLSWIQFLKERGWRAFDYSTFEEFWEVLLEKGGWWDPTDPEPRNQRIFKTRSGKFEFYSQTLHSEVKKLLTVLGGSQGQMQVLNERWKIDAHGDSIFLPHYEAPRFRKESIDFPYHFLTYQVLANMNGRAAYLALSQEMSALRSREYWRSWVEISPETARRLGIGEDDYVNIISPKGRFSVKARVLPTIMPDVIVMPFGLGHEYYGRFGKRIGINPYAFLEGDTDVISGIPSLISTKVRIEKAKDRGQV